jgi:hypothetical protein
MALAGHNSIIAPTGQEEIQYQVLTEQFGVSDLEVRNWTMGPAWLTWSRGQNSHGNGVGGPLPRSFMKNQWSLQKQILARYRSLGIVGHLPAFGGYAPWAVAVAQNATNRIARGKGSAVDTAWIDGRDPLYTSIADAWVNSVIADFGSDHVWQMDSFFANGSSWGTTSDEGHNSVIDSSASSELDAVLPPCVWTAAINNTYLAGYVTPSCGGVGTSVSFPTLWEAKTACASETYTDCGGVVSRRGTAFELRAGSKPLPVPASDGETSYVVTNRAECVPVVPPCVWSAVVNDTYLAGYVTPGKSVLFPTLAEAKTACLNATYRENCGGVVSRRGTAFELRAGSKPLPVPASDGEASYVVTNRAECAPICPDDVEIWHNRSAAAYGAVARADGPSARWIYQGYALGVGGGLGPKHAGAFKAFTGAVPEGQFIVLDMSAHGTGQWHDRYWKGQWGLPFIWTPLHTYGGSISMKGNLSEINVIPFDAPPLAAVPKGYDPKTQAVGVGYTPEGLDQNTAYYELLQEAAFKAQPESNLTSWLVNRANRRYGTVKNPDVAAAWVALGASG